MKIFNYLFFALTVVSNVAFGQMTEDPTTWKYEVKKKGTGEYQLIFHLNLKDGWHIWSLKPGGDGYEIAPSFDFAANPKVKLKGKLAEKGKLTTLKMEGIEGKVNYMTGKVDYAQDVTVTGSTEIKGRHTYQVCNDRMCLPPKDREFEFEVKP